MKDVNLSEDTIQKTEILMNSATSLRIILCLALSFGIWGSLFAQPILPGVVSEAEIIESSKIYEIYVDRYQPNKNAINYLSAYPDSLEIYVFWGGWCRESTKYIPGFIKVMRLSNNDFIKVTYVAVDYSKKEPELFLNKFDIEYIPSVVVFKEGIEIGRIEEKPHILIETDLIEILRAGKEKDE